MAGTLQYDTFVFPTDPETLHMTFRHDVTVTPTGAGQWTVVDGAHLGRIVEGEGVFYGENAYTDFSRLAKYISSFQALVLRHPRFEAFRAHLTRLESIEMPCDGCLKYRFTFVESPTAA